MSSMGTLPSPRTATALSFFEPMTAPRPERPAAEPLCVIIAEMSESFSPAGPMAMTLVSLPCSSLKVSSVSKVLFPQRRAASRSSALPLLIKR